jgi:hypothetical protein
MPAERRRSSELQGKSCSCTISQLSAIWICPIDFFLLSSKSVPVVGRYRPVEDGVDLAEEDSKLRHGVLRIGGNSLAAVTMYQELVPSSAKGSGKTKEPQPADELTPFDRFPSWHGVVD